MSIEKSVKVKLLPLFQDKLKKIKDKNQLEIIFKLIKKLERMGKNALKILDVEDFYLLAEMKVKRPPYRLYVIVNQSTDTFYVVEWEHKKKQERVINELIGKLKLAIEVGLENVFI